MLSSLFGLYRTIDNKRMGNADWFYELNWVYMSLIAAGFAAGIHMIAAIVAALRIGRGAAFAFVLFAPIATFISCLFYVVILAISVGYTYQFVEEDLRDYNIHWGLGLGVFYLVIKIVVAGYIK